ncbi:sensor histidine kinase [Winogradskyella flava]|uniref:sensor histidine kinase n=1 Tax=Winogradskyella flava TaxID=1884876 RepID=UPI002491B997|nr:HAMP domain-containing sensor histidine kinase [Winogradskyella flava]
MKRNSIIIIVLSLLILVSLIIWQLNHLNEEYQLKSDLDKTEMQAVLLESAIELRKIENVDKSLRNELDRLSHFTDSILKKNFKSFDSNIIWGYFNGLKEPIASLNSNTSNNELEESSLKVCTSCLLMIGIVKDVDPGTVGAKDIEESGYILDHTPAQMRDVRGIDEADLKYLHILPSPKKIGLLHYAVPIVFLIGLSSLFIWLIYLNNKQTKLIKQKNEFVNHLSHQFQTPLSSIKLSANLLVNKKASNENELITIIQTESNRLENHIKTVLHWVKSDADRLHINKKVISVTDIIERSLKQMKPVFITNKTKISFIPSEDDFKVLADENHLQLMLFNIWENAIKHNEKPIELTIDYFTNEGYISIRTSDNGIGLPKDIAPEKFKGLGLAYVHRLMSEHLGNMELDSVKNKGLSVQLNFPTSND